MMNELIKNKVEVSRLIYHNPKNNWGVFAYVNDGSIPEITDAEVKVSGNFYGIYEGATVEFAGDIVVHPTYGRQVSLKNFRVITDSTSKQGIIDFLTRSSISGIARANAEKIYDKFGEDSIKVVLNETEKIMCVGGIGEKTYAKVLKSVNKYKDQEELINFCNSLGGIPYRVMISLYDSFGVNAVKLLKQDPYALLAKSNLSFKQIDDIALKMNLPIDHESRLKVGLLYVLKNESSLKGSTGCDYQELRKVFLKELGLVDTNLYQYTLDTLEKEELVVVEFNEVYLKEFYDAEKSIADYLLLCKTALIHRDYDPQLVEDEINGFDFKLNEQQVHAVKSCLENKFNIITSLAGGGKSTITKAIVNILDKSGEEVILLAPTGKAAKRLNECTGYPTSTIHRFLGYKDNMDNVGINPVGFNTTIIVDEASMVDVILLNKIIANTVDDTRLILVGDTHQLPSVQAGNILEDIINSKLFNVCMLTDIMRQAENSNIIKYCSYVNGDKTFKPTKTSDFIYLNFNSREEILNQMIPAYAKAVGKYGLQETQVLCAYKLGTLGMNNLNKVLKDAVNKNEESDSFPFSVGDKVRHTKNNYKKNVFNGETGIVSNIELASDNLFDVDEDTLTVDYGDRLVCYNKGDINELHLSYASTVHSSQGSEYKTVFVILDNEVSNILLIRKIIYTALSRAKQKCILLSTGDCVDKAIHNDFYKQRITKLQDFLEGNFEWLQL